MAIRGYTVIKPVSFKFGGAGDTTTSTTYVVVADSDIALDPSDFVVSGSLYVRFIYHFHNQTTGEVASIEVYRQNDVSSVTGSEATTTGTSWAIKDTGWIDWSGESGDESYQIRIKTTDGGTIEFNSALMILSYSDY